MGNADLRFFFEVNNDASGLSSEKEDELIGETGRKQCTTLLLQTFYRSAVDEHIILDTQFVANRIEMKCDLKKFWICDEWPRKVFSLEKRN